jgi:hypothetical protein
VIDAVHEAFAEWLALPDPDRGGHPFDTVDLALATVVANRLDGDPLWLFLVAPPSSGKTETLMSLVDTQDVYPLNNLTPATFVSGYERKGEDASLLPRVDGKTIVMKDFTSILTMHRDARAEILSQLREIYDGAYSKDFGNGKHVEWRGKVGLLAGVTPVIDREYAFNAALGERFLLSRVRTAPARTLARRALEQRSREADQRRRLRQLVADFLTCVPLEPPPIPSDISEGLCALAEFAAVARSPIHFDYRGEIDYIPEPEGPARLVKQLALMSQALSLVRAEPETSLATYVTACAVAQDTLPAQRRVILEALLAPERGETATTTEITEATKYPTSSARRYLQELTALRLVDRQPAEQGRADRWSPSDRLRDLLSAMSAPLSSTPLSSNVGERV